MKRKRYNFITVLLLAFIIIKSPEVANAQTSLFDAVNQELGTSIVSVLLWPMYSEKEDHLKVSSMSVSYKVPVSMIKKTELAFDFKKFERISSAVYDEAIYPKNEIFKAFDKNLSGIYEPVFENIENDTHLRIVSSKEDNQEVVYLISSKNGKTELLNFRYKPSRKSESQIKLLIKELDTK